MDKSDISFEKYYEDVLRFLRGLSRDEYLAEELAQETMYRAIKSIRTFKGDCELRVWLCTIAKNLFFTYCKRQKRLSYEENCENFEAEEELFVQIIEDRETAFRMHRILHDMKEPYKEVFPCGYSGNCHFGRSGSFFRSRSTGPA